MDVTGCCWQLNRSRFKEHLLVFQSRRYFRGYAVVDDDSVELCRYTIMKAGSVHVSLFYTFIFQLTLLISILINNVNCIGEIVYAINAGGEAHTDSHGIHYQRDPLHGKTGTASDFGKQLLIGRVAPADMILYQTERYHTKSFGYEISNIKDDGNYVLVLKFCEVYFKAPNMKVFDVYINDVVSVLADMDIYLKVGRGIAHDEYIPFQINKGRLIIGEDVLPFNGKLKVDFIKGPRDNPKINALYVVKGTLDDIPKLPPIETEDELFKEEPTESKVSSRQPRNPSGPRSPDPYTLDESSTMLPIFIALVAFIPILFCLCKL